MKDHEQAHNPASKQLESEGKNFLSPPAFSLNASPVVFSQIWLFVAPGLYASERKVVLPLVISSTVLLLSGGAFCYYVMFGYGFKFLLDVVGTDTAAVLSMSAYLSMAIKFLLAFGLSFQLPVVVWFFG